MDIQWHALHGGFEEGDRCVVIIDGQFAGWFWDDEDDEHIFCYRPNGEFIGRSMTRMTASKIIAGDYARRTATVD